MQPFKLQTNHHNVINNNNNSANNNNHHSSNHNNNNHNVSNGINRNNGLTTTNANANATKNRLNATYLDNNNKFTPDTEFVADFGSAHIFNATSTNATSNTSSNFTNGNATHKFMNGGRTHTAVESNEVTASNGITDSANENFADFDHNPIYNAAGNSFLHSINYWSRSI